MQGQDNQNNEIRETLDIEEFALANPDKQKPKAKVYAYRVNKKRLTTTSPTPTREQVLESAGLVPVNEYRLRLKDGSGDPREINNGEIVDLTKPGVERFIANRLHVQDGLTERFEFDLPADDAAFLNGLNLRWETLNVSGRLWLLIKQWTPPAPFVPTPCDIAFDLSSYPAGVIDMAYFFPAIVRTDGKVIPQADHQESIDGKMWQRWSRHRVDGLNTWNPESDSIATHYAYMLDWFVREMGR